MFLADTESNFCICINRPHLKGNIKEKAFISTYL